jgi:lipid-binding SYLF domain-containing protein
METTMHRTRRAILSCAILASVTLGASGYALAAERLTEADNTIKTFQKTDPGLARFFEKSAGYAVFPRVGKGGVGFGGAYGAGVLFEKGKPTGKTSLTQVTVGLQLGAQTYSEVIFFETEEALAQFKSSHFAFSAQASAVALRSGASANAKYTEGVAVFTAATNGLMFEGSLGGQRFNFKPFKSKSAA